MSRIPRTDSQLQARMARWHETSDAFWLMPLGITAFFGAAIGFPLAYESSWWSLAFLLPLLVLAGLLVLVYLRWHRVSDYGSSYGHRDGVPAALRSYTEITEPALLAKARPLYASWRQALLAYDAADDYRYSRRTKLDERHELLETLARRQGEINAQRLLATRGGDVTDDHAVHDARAFLKALDEMEN